MLFSFFFNTECVLFFVCLHGPLQVVADIDNDGADELVVAASYYFDRE